ncbi:hypothetical protein Tsubulata_043167, partial [Turnera subulata]
HRLCCPQNKGTSIVILLEFDTIYISTSNTTSAPLLQRRPYKISSCSVRGGR